MLRLILLVIDHLQSRRRSAGEAAQALWFFKAADSCGATGWLPSRCETCGAMHAVAPR